MSSSKQHPFLEFPQIKPPLLMMGKSLKWKPNAIEIAPSCPRCFSSNTKFCYYNNYSVSQPRYFCKACRRYWTKGGSLRNVPVGGGCRKSRRSRAARPESPTAAASEPAKSGGDSGKMNVVKDSDECSNFAASSASSTVFECVETGGAVDEKLREAQGCFDGGEFVCENFGVFDVGSEMVWSDLEGLGCEEAAPLMEMREFEELFAREDDDRLRLCDDNWGSFDLSAYDNFF